MTRLTENQLATLRWLHDIGGTCIPFGEKLAHPWFAQPLRQRRGQQEPREAYRRMSAVSGAHLVAHGYVEGSGGFLRITEMGRRVIR